MLVVQVKEGDNIERALKKYKRKFEKTKKAVYVEQLKRNLSEI
jgi:ribosomal protein S21